MSDLSAESNGEFRGRGKGRCSCGVEYFYHVADGGAEIIGLWPGEFDQITPASTPLPKIWEQLGIMESAA